MRHAIGKDAAMRSLCKNIPSFLALLGVLLLSVSPLRAQPQSHIEVQVRPLSAAVAAIPPGRGSSSMRRAADDMWERAQDGEAYVVQIEISNPTDRAYLLKANKVTLRTESGERARPLATNEDSPTPVLTDQTIAPGVTVQGYLSFPPGTYTGARGFLVEEQTKANEGFSVDF